MTMHLFELAPSPNSIKARLALRLKDLEFECTSIERGDRTAVLKASGQEMTPVLLSDNLVITDSEAILHYLDANFPGTPRLFPITVQDRRACEAWKVELDTKIGQHWMPVFFHGIGVREQTDEDAAAAYRDALKWLDEKIGQDTHVMHGGDNSVCDLRVAQWAIYGLPGPALVERAPIYARFQELFGVEPGSLPNLERFLTPWQQRLG